MSEFEKHPKNRIMSRILEIRYSDLEMEQSLCRDLLAWAEKEKDLYAHAFALTYLGDYAVAMNDMEEAVMLLYRAKSLAEHEIGVWDELILRIYNLLAICYEVQADEQSSIQYYMDAIRVAKRVGDVSAQALIYNNLAFAFQRHHSYEQAAEYYKNAHILLEGVEDRVIKPIVYSNLAEMLLILGRTEEALEYIALCAKSLENFPKERELHEVRIWCCYHAVMGEREKTLEMADRVVEQMEGDEGQRFSMFDNYRTLFWCMMKIKNQEYAKRFLDMMEKIGRSGGLDQLWALEEQGMEYSLCFEPAEKHPEAYCRFFKRTQELQSRGNTAIVYAMKGRISLEEAIQQQRQLQTEQETLEQQANMDELAQIYNRRFLEKLLRERAAEARTGNLGMIMLDIDYFKEYNDFYGHMEGDRVIQTVGACLKKNVVEGIFPCRYGGDEFTCFCDGLTPEEIETYIRKVQADLAEANLLHEKSLCSHQVTLSVGYGAETDGTTPYALLELADQALYTVKLSGRNAFSRKRAGGI